MHLFFKFTLLSILVAHINTDVVGSTGHVSNILVTDGGYVHSIGGTTEMDQFTFKGRLRVGERATARCRVLEGIGPFDFHLMKDDKHLYRNTSNILIRHRPRARVIEISSLTMADAGNYTCIVTDRGTTITRIATTELTVEDLLPVITKEISNITVSEGSNATLECNVKNIGDHTIRWIHFESLRDFCVNKTTHIQDPRYKVFTEDSHKWILHISNVTQEDSGQYMCEISTTPPVYGIRYLNVTYVSSEGGEEGLHTIYKDVILILTALIVLGSCLYSCIYFKVTKQIRRSLRGDPRKPSLLRRHSSPDIHCSDTIHFANEKPLLKLEGVVVEKPSDTDLSKGVPAQIIEYTLPQPDYKKTAK